MKTDKNIKTAGGTTSAMLHSGMQLIPNYPRAAALLESVAAQPLADIIPPTVPDFRSKLKRSGSLGGNGRAIFLGLLLGALAISAAGYVHSRYPAVAPEFIVLSRKFLAVRTKTVVPAKDSSPDRLSVEVGPELLRVTAIALGHPRLAVINGKELAEGDTLTVQDRRGGVTVTLRVVKIADGAIELANGSHIVTTRLAAHTGR